MIYVILTLILYVVIVVANYLSMRLYHVHFNDKNASGYGAFTFTIKESICWSILFPLFWILISIVLFYVKVAELCYWLGKILKDFFCNFDEILYDWFQSKVKWFRIKRDKLKFFKDDSCD